MKEFLTFEKTNLLILSVQEIYLNIFWRLDFRSSGRYPEDVSDSGFFWHPIHHRSVTPVGRK